MPFQHRHTNGSGIGVLITLGDRMSHKPLAGSETQVASLWTPHYIYFAYWCRYQSLNIYAGEDPAKERWELWNRDVVEAFINPQPERFLTITSWKWRRTTSGSTSRRLTQQESDE